MLQQRLLTAFLPTIATSSSTTEFAESHGPCYTRASNTRGPHSDLHLLRHPTNELEQYSQLQNMKPLKSKEGYQAPGFFLDGGSNMESFVLWSKVPKWTLKIFIDYQALNLCRFYLPPSGAHVSYQGIQSTFPSDTLKNQKYGRPM